MTLDIAGVHYSIGKLSAKQQFHIVKRLLPVAKSFAPMFQSGAQLPNLNNPLGANQGAPNADGTPGPTDNDGSASLQQAIVSRAAENDVDVVETVSMFASSLRDISDEDSDKIFDTCLRVVQREDNGRWYPLVTPTGQLMYQDIENNLSIQLRLVWEVLKANLENFSFDNLQIFGT